MAEREIVLVNITGRDRPGLTAALTSVLARYDVGVLDIGQSVIHDDLTLGLLIQVPNENASGAVFKDFLFRAHELGLNVRFTPICEDEYEGWVTAQGQPRHIITLLARRITSHHIHRVAEVIAGHGLNIDGIVRLSGRLSLRSGHSPRPASVEISARGRVNDMAAMHGTFLGISRELSLDVAIQEDNAWRRNRRLVCFDMDSTLIQTELIDELATVAGVGDQVARITEAAMRGELDFAQSFRRRIGLLKGLDARVLEQVARRLPITEGAERLIRNLKGFGYKIAILSGGFTYFAGRLAQSLGIDYVYANELEVRDGRLTGEVHGEIIDGRRKAELLQHIVREEGISLEQVIAVGDGANDLPMLSIAGLGIAYRAKPLVSERARHSIATVGLDGILYLLGVRDRELPEDG